MLKEPATGKTSPDRTLGEPDIKEHAVNTTSAKEARVSTAYDEGQQNIVGQEEWKKPRTKSSSKEDEATTGCDPRVRKTETNLRSRSYTTTTTKQGLVNDCTRDKEQDVVVGQRKLTSSEVSCDINRIVGSLGRLAPTATKYDRPLQELVQAGLDWIKSLQTEPAAEEQAPPLTGQMLVMGTLGIATEYHGDLEKLNKSCTND